MNRPVGASRRLRSATAKTPKKSRGEVILDALERLLTKTQMSKLDVEPIATEAGITRARFYAYYKSKHDALAALLRRLLAIREAVAEHSGSWFAGRLPEVRPRDALRETIERVTESWWPHRFVLREACDLWAVVPEVRDAWLKAIEVSTTRLEKAILRERALGVAPPGYNARRLAEALAWQNERLHFRAWAGLPGAMSKKQLCEVALESYMRLIFLDDDPDPEGAR
jgi:AcrR family transcriptional regulator